VLQMSILFLSLKHQTMQQMTKLLKMWANQATGN